MYLVSPAAERLQSMSLVSHGAAARRPSPRPNINISFILRNYRVESPAFYVLVREAGGDDMAAVVEL